MEDGKKKKVLIVDDEKEMVAMLKMRIESNGYDVSAAYDGDEGLKAIEAAPPDLLILDINMPKMNGIAFYNQLKGIYPDIGKKFIFISGGTDAETMQTIEQENLVFMAKPFHVSDILQKVYEILDRAAL